MRHWTPATVTPKEESKSLLLLISLKRGDRWVTMGYFKGGRYYTPNFRLVYTPGDGLILGWMDISEFENYPMGYDPNFGRDRLCKCGDPYYRHFDTYDNMNPVGCKYCHHHEEGIAYRKRTSIPEGTDTENWTYEDWAPYEGICSGFSLAEGQ